MVSTWTVATPVVTTPGSEKVTSRVITVPDAARCCRSVLERATQPFRDLAYFIDQAGFHQTPGGEANIAVVPGDALQAGIPAAQVAAALIISQILRAPGGNPLAPRVIRIPPAAGPLIAGAVIIGTAAEMDLALADAGRSIVAGWILGVAGAVIDLAREAEPQAERDPQTKRFRNPCVACMMQRALPQAPQKRTVRKVSSRN